MTQKWNLQDIRPTNPRPNRSSAPNRQYAKENGASKLAKRPTTDNSLKPNDTEDSNSPAFNNLPNVEIVNSKKRRGSKLLITIFSLFIIIGGAIGISFLTGGAVINIYPKNRTVTVNADFTALKEKQPGELTYEILTLEATGERQVTATGQETVQEQASGIIEIVKTTPGAERLIKNTRFQTADGKIYRIQESVVVPGAVANENGDLKSGRIQAEVFADDVGDDYNISAGQRFTVPGFAESGLTQLYEAVYATNPRAFSGGFDGPRFIIDENELATARQSLQLELRNTLLEKVHSNIPHGFVSFDNAVAIVYNELPAVQYGDSLVTIREQDRKSVV